MQSGIINGYIGQVEYLVTRMKNEMIARGEQDPYVVATGGLATLIAGDSPNVDLIILNLTLEGLRIIYEKNKE